jgi:transposase-like protein
MVRPGRDRLGGAVEVDETYIGCSKPGKRGRGAAGKVLVLVAAQEDENRIGRIRLRRIADASANSLEEAVQEMVVPGSTVRTDDWSG